MILLSGGPAGPAVETGTIKEGCVLKNQAAWESFRGVIEEPR
jgi:hypothetical protein